MLVEGEHFYPPMLADIAAATSSVHINQFGFRPGDVGERFAEALIAKAARASPSGSSSIAREPIPTGPAADFYGRLLAAGIEVGVVRATQPARRAGCSAPAGRALEPAQLGHIDHRKIVVVDGRVGWVGGAGIEDHFQDGRFHDLFLRVTGPVVSQLQLVFLASFRWLGGEVPAGELDDLFPEHDARAHRRPGRRAPQRARSIQADHDSDRPTPRHRAARRSTSSIPTSPTAAMIRRIARAARRGVPSRLFVPAEANNWACAAAQQFHHKALLDAGVRILEYPTMLHAKAFVRDGEEVLAGTCNLEAWSLKRFFEIDLLVRSRSSRRSSRSGSRSPPRPCRGRAAPSTGFRARGKAAAFAAISPLL